MEKKRQAARGAPHCVPVALFTPRGFMTGGPDACCCCCPVPAAPIALEPTPRSAERERERASRQARDGRGAGPLAVVIAFACHVGSSVPTPGRRGLGRARQDERSAARHAARPVAEPLQAALPHQSLRDRVQFDQAERALAAPRAAARAHVQGHRARQVRLRLRAELRAALVQGTHAAALDQHLARGHSGDQRPLGAPPRQRPQALKRRLPADHGVPGLDERARDATAVPAGELPARGRLVRVPADAAREEAAGRQVRRQEVSAQLGRLLQDERDHRERGCELRELAVPAQVTPCERVLPHRRAQQPRDRAHECASGSTNTKTATSEAVTLSDVYALVGEWAPFGSNQIMALNERIGALDRCQGGILTSIVDAAPTDTQFHMPLGQTQVWILDFDFVRFINFEAESHFPETSGIVQIDHFGIHMNCDGSLIYGMKVEAIMHRRGDDISIDHLARLLVDVHQDSSLLVNDLLSRYQVSLLEMLYLGDSFHRNKYNCVLAKQMRPQLPAKAYVENPLYANELAQVLGDVYASHDITAEGDVLVVGRAGCLFSGPNIVKYESICTAYVALVCRDMFTKNFFARTFVLDATLKEVRRLVHKVHREPATALQVREKLAVVSKDTVLLAETLEYLLDSLEGIQLAPEPAQPSAHHPTRIASATEGATQGNKRESDAGVEARLLGALALHQLKAQTTMRCHDSIKLMEDTMLQLEQLQMIAEATATNQLEIACQRVDLNTRGLMEGAAHQEKSLLTLQALQYVIAGLFVFDVIDRLTGGTWNTHLPKWVDDALVAPALSYPFLWWTINMVVYGLFFWFLHVASRRLAQRILGWTTLRIEVNRKISLPQLRNMVAHRTVKKSSALHVGATSGSAVMRFRSLAWKEADATAWSGVLQTIELCYDDQHSFLLFATLHFDTKASEMREEECCTRSHELFAEEKIYVTGGTTVADTGVE